MTRDPETVASEAPLTEVAAIMRDADTGTAPVTEGEELRGDLAIERDERSALADISAGEPDR
jgi:CBS domain-containing protein